MHDVNLFNTALLDFLRHSPTPFHATANLVAMLDEAGFSRLAITDRWRLDRGGRYYITQNGSALLAFTYGRSGPEDSGWRMAGAHTDSPCLKVKPNPELTHRGYWQLGVEVYGGVLLNPWFDRDLSLAGRVSYRQPDGAVASALIDFERPLAVIPSLAIHLDREANTSRSVNAQRDLPPVLARLDGGRLDDGKRGDEQALDLREVLAEQLRTGAISGGRVVSDVAEVLDYELSFYDTQPPALVGWQSEFIASARLDNLLSCFVAVQALIASDGEYSCLAMCNDHEEVGSQSTAGAQGPVLRSMLERIAGSAEACARAVDQSLFVSCDNAHALHPNFADRHDANHGPSLNGGPVLKINANQRYATNSETGALFRQLCSRVDAPLQSFVVRTDMACGSTIGPITAGNIGVATVDVGIPQLAMHSIRETCGAADPHRLYRVLVEFNRSPRVTCSG